jgi:hypothetical protein
MERPVDRVDPRPGSPGVELPHFGLTEFWQLAFQAGAAFVYLGSATGIDRATGEPEDAFGISVSGTGDIDGDGFNDLIVGAEGADSGTAHVYRGGCVVETIWYADTDGNGFGDADSEVASCDVLRGHHPGQERQGRQRRMRVRQHVGINERVGPPRGIAAHPPPVNTPR